MYWKIDMQLLLLINVTPIDTLFYCVQGICRHTLPTTDIFAPENRWLEDERSSFWGKLGRFSRKRAVSFGEGIFPQTGYMWNFFGGKLD